MPHQLLAPRLLAVHFTAFTANHKVTSTAICRVSSTYTTAFPECDWLHGMIYAIHPSAKGQTFATHANLENVFNASSGSMTRRGILLVHFGNIGSKKYGRTPSAIILSQIYPDCVILGVNSQSMSLTWKVAIPRRAASFVWASVVSRHFLSHTVRVAVSWATVCPEDQRCEHFWVYNEAWTGQQCLASRILCRHKIEF
jgi:hypothetical protein